MLVNCPECHSPVFVRAAAVEQRKPQRCYACKAQLLVDPDGAVEVAVSGSFSVASLGEAAAASRAPASESPPAARSTSTSTSTSTAPANPPPPQPKGAEPRAPASYDARPTEVVRSPFAAEAAPPSDVADATRPLLSRAPNAYAPAPAAPRPVTVVTTVAALAEGERARTNAFPDEATTEGPAPVSLASMPPLTEATPEPSVVVEPTPEPSVVVEATPEPSVVVEATPEPSVVVEATPEPPAAALSVPRQASLPDIPLVPDDELPFGDASEIAADLPPVADPTNYATLLSAPAIELPTDTAAMPSPFDPSDEGSPASPRFADRPVEELFDRSGAHLTPASLDDIPTAAGVPLPSDEGPPLVTGSLLDEAPVAPPLAPASVSAFDVELVPVESPPVVDAAPPEPEPEPPEGADAPLRLPTDHDDAPYVQEPPARSGGGALAWLGALVLGVGLGAGALYTYPPAPDLTPLEQKLANAADLIARGRPADAVPLLEGALRDAPDHPLALRRLAIATSLTGDVTAAERHYLRYLEVSDDDGDKREVRTLLGLDDGAR